MLYERRRRRGGGRRRRRRRGCGIMATKSLCEMKDFVAKHRRLTDYLSNAPSQLPVVCSSSTALTWQWLDRTWTIKSSSAQLDAAIQYRIGERVLMRATRQLCKMHTTNCKEWITKSMKRPIDRCRRRCCLAAYGPIFARQLARKLQFFCSCGQ